MRVKLLMISCLWNKILTSLLPSIQSCSLKSWASFYIASNFDRSRRGSQTQDYRQVSSAKISYMYKCKVSQVFLQLVVAPGNLDELLIGRYKVLEAEQYDVLRKYGLSTGDVQKIDPTIVFVIHTCRDTENGNLKVLQNYCWKYHFWAKGWQPQKGKTAFIWHWLMYILTDISLQIEQPVNPRMCGCPVTSLGNNLLPSKFKISTKLVSDQF